MTGPEAAGTNWNAGDSLRIQKNTFLQGGLLNSCAGCAERLWSIHSLLPWKKGGTGVTSLQLLHRRVQPVGCYPPLQVSPRCQVFSRLLDSVIFQIPLNMILDSLLRMTLLEQGACTRPSQASALLCFCHCFCSLTRAWTGCGWAVLVLLSLYAGMSFWKRLYVDLQTEKEIS